MCQLVERREEASRVLSEGVDRGQVGELHSNQVNGTYSTLRSGMYDFKQISPVMCCHRYFLVFHFYLVLPVFGSD